MEQQQRSLVFTASVGLIILAIIVGSIYYLIKFIQARVASSGQIPQASVSQVVQASGSPEGGSVAGAQIRPNSSPTVSSQAVTANSNQKIYNPGNFQLSYPKNWGVVTCTNSKNIELDPGNIADSKINCQTALKSITVLVDKIDNCDGQNIKIGNTEVIKSKKIDSGWTVYQWCTKTNPVLNITHRVSPNGERATSKQDYSTQIEDMIKSLNFTHAS